MKKKILIISQHFYPEIGSAGNRVKNIYQLLIQKGYEVSIITSDPAYPSKKIYEDRNFWDDPSIKENANISRIQVTNRKYSRSIMNRLFFYVEVALKIALRILKDKGKYDYVFATSPPIFIAIVGYLAKVKFKSRFILDIRDLWPESLKGVGIFNNIFVIKLFSGIEKILYKQADHIIVNSMGFIDYIHNKAYIPLEKISYIPNAAREDEINRDHQPAGGPKVIYTGNIGFAQNIDFFKQLAEKLSQHNIELTIIGYGIKSKELKEYIQKKKLKNVTLHSPLTRKECLNTISRHHIGIVSLSDKEVFDTVLPGKVVDYMTCKIPIVASVSGYSKKVIEKNKVGLVSETRDVDEIINYIQHLLNDPRLRNEMSQNSEKTIIESFLWEKNINLLEEIIEGKYKNLIENRG
ncbi:glycosyltransferase family 4 protein [Cytobacillus oceanisediminis]|uniref:glycosyltransferase family 4 protein n=1 Tax=Cytobacillus oceanisediminis TaxID=665099 RepID=UPI00203D9D22|nr:glycosyltransferase family 4 protein [Cytobacillus oceanisediminis]MCM3244945.1 glycosyltransferase family 4 protein [Cytobacillus oceanisediminis]